MTSEYVEELKVLALLELELDQFVSRKVAEAKKAGLTWDEIAQASGVSKPSAWRRWKDAVDDPRPTRPVRRDASRLSLSDASEAVMQRLTSELVEQALKRQGEHPWSGAVRMALEKLSRPYEVTQRGSREIEFRLPGSRVHITCLEPGSQGSGGLSVLIAPSPEVTLTGRGKAEIARLVSETPVSAGSHELVDAVTAFLRQQIERAGSRGHSSAGSPDEPGRT